MEFIPLSRQFQTLKTEILQQIGNILDSGTYIMGPKVYQLERAIASRLGVREAIAVANGTDALVLTLTALGIGPGDEVITTPFTFFATAEAISRVGARPVFSDIDPATCNLDPAQIEEKITSRTKAIIPVHLFGLPADMHSLQVIADRHGLPIIEDACQAFGAAYAGKPIGSWGRAACFSFFPTKNLGTMGDGGIVTTNDPHIAQTIRELRHHGSGKQKYYHHRIGFNSRLDEIHAAILLLALERIDGWNAERRRLAARYRMHLQHHPWIQISTENPIRLHVYHLFCIRSKYRDRLIAALNRRQVPSGIYYPCPLHLQEAYSDLGYKPGDFPAAEAAAKELLALPISPMMHEHEQDEVIRALFEAEGLLSNG
jgi:dTDP-4-amino-4,6-dideoxygalactose transaminase